ncbi:MAG: aldolase/citrate lyase family protein [Microvirga sp.]|nr:aldolase/citrate lyase family protein [Microvirga sp.]
MSLRVGLAACLVRSVEILPIARHAGFDFVLADMEHGPLSLADAAALCVAGREAGYPVFVRAPGAGASDIPRIVDCGARGLVVPHVDGLAQARAIVDATRFPPLGRRSIPYPVAATGFRPVAPAELIARSEEGFELFLMIESREGLDECEAIAALDGVDGLIVGANDLTQALGAVGDLDAPHAREAFQRVADAARAAGKTFGVMGVPDAFIRTHALDLGATWIIAANDVNLLFEAAESRVTSMRALDGG